MQWLRKMYFWNTHLRLTFNCNRRAYFIAKLIHSTAYNASGISGQRWCFRQGSFPSIGEFRFTLVFYLDGFEVANPLGTWTKKLCAVYLVFLNLDPKFCASLLGRISRELCCGQYMQVLYSQSRNSNKKWMLCESVQHFHVIDGCPPDILHDLEHFWSHLNCTCAFKDLTEAMFYQDKRQEWTKGRNNHENWFLIRSLHGWVSCTWGRWILGVRMGITVFQIINHSRVQVALVKK